MLLHWCYLQENMLRISLCEVIDEKAAAYNHYTRNSEITSVSVVEI